MLYKHTTERPQIQPLNLDQIVKGVCPVCNHSLTVAYFHLGGYFSRQPFLVCDNIEGGYTHLHQRIPDWLDREYRDLLNWQEVDYGAWQEDQAEEIA